MNKKLAVFLYRIEQEDILREESHIRELLDDSRKEKVARLKNDSARIQSIAAGMLLKVGTSLFLEGKAEKYMYGYGDRDYLISHEELLERLSSADQVPCGEIYSNLSHSGEYVALAVGNVPVGIDVEHKSDNDFKVTKRMFTKRDQDYIFGDMLDAERRFRDIWTIKESFLKCLGIGISVPLSSFDASFDALFDQFALDEVDRYGGEGAILSGKIEVREDAPDKLQGLDHYCFSTSRISGGDYSLTLCYRDSLQG